MAWLAEGGSGVQPKTILEGIHLARVEGNSPRRFAVVGIVVLGCLAALLSSAKLADADTMVASWYGPGFEGATTASGEPFNAGDFTAAHKTLPFGTKLTVTLEGRSVVVRVNDRGPYVTGRDLDLSQAAAEQIGLTALGEATVSVVIADPSTPTGPVSGTAAPAPTTPAPTEPVPTASTPVGPGVSAGKAAGVEQYADEDQYDAAVGDQYAKEDVAPQAPPVVPAAATPPVPDPLRLETPPAELATPGSTVERRVVLVLAAPPAEYEGLAPGAEIEVSEPEPTEPAPATEAAPKAASAVAPEAETTPLTVLPNTGGASLAGLVGGVLLVSLGAGWICRRHRFSRNLG